jgi:acyl-CoA thioesterase FadM
VKISPNTDMGIIHIPRVVAAIARGKFASRDPTLGFASPHMYKARAGPLDYFMHLNNAAYLTHAELARWQWLAQTGLLDHMRKTKTDMIVARNNVRYRQEITPFLQAFTVETAICKIDEKRMYCLHAFRTSSSKSKAQILSQQVFVRKGQALAPANFLKEANIDSSVVDELMNTSSDEVDDLIRAFLGFDESFRKVAAIDDARHEAEDI